MMRKGAFVLAAIALVAMGCGRTPFPVLEAQLDGLKGQPAKDAIKKLGAPNDSQTIAGEKVYVWTSGNTKTLVGDPASMIDFQCTVRVFVDKDENITHYDFKGNVGGCARYAHQLDESYDLVHWSTPS
jgi:hypothetical protein